MTKKEYADILKLAIMMQIEYQKEEIQQPWADERFHDGIITGLKIALEKIDSSSFLWEE